MAKAKSLAKRIKPEKPYPAFPLTPHNNGQWCKKVRGDVHFFGVWADPDGALDLWKYQEDDLRAGRTPRQPGDNRPTVKDLVDRFMHRQSERLDIGKISDRTFDEYRRVGVMIADALGRTAVVEELRPADFTRLNDAFSEYAVSIQGKLLTVARMFFRWGWESELLKSPVRFGPDFKPPTRKDVRIAKAERGEQFVEQAELATLLASAAEPLRTIILLGINAGLGAGDIATIAVKDVDGDWLTLHRQKTGAPRRIPLWKETVAGLKLAIGRRTGDELAFVTRWGNAFVTEYRKEKTLTDGSVQSTVVRKDAIGQEFKKLAASCKIARPGLTFYALRHTFQTVGDGAKDPVATSAVMGHIDPSMAGRYRERVDDDRLRAVANHIRAWVFPKKRKGK